LGRHAAKIDREHLATFVGRVGELLDALKLNQIFRPTLAGEQRRVHVN